LRLTHRIVKVLGKALFNLVAYLYDFIIF